MHIPALFNLTAYAPKPTTYVSEALLLCSKALQSAIGMIVAIVGLTVVVSLSSFSAIRFVQAAEASAQVVRRLRATETYFGLVRDAETGQRGYILTGDSICLDLYTQASAQAPRAAIKLRAMQHVDPELFVTAKAKLAELDATVRLAQRGRHEEAMAIVRNRSGVKLMQTLRYAVGRIQRRSEAELLVQESIQAYAATVMTRGLPVAGGSCLMLVILCFAATLRELRARRAAEQAAESAMAQLRRSNADLEQFAYAASHDLQEPLRMMGSFADLLATRYTDQLDEKANGWLLRITDGAARGAQMINDLLAYARLSTKVGVSTTFVLTDVFEEARENLAICIEETGADIIIGSLPRIIGDRGQWLLVAQNLLANAIKYHKADVAPKIVISVLSNTLSIADNGIGIDPMFHDKIFDMFTRIGVNKIKGTGLGLSLVRKIVERHGGTVRVVSSSGNGATFFVTVPCASGSKKG